MTQKHLLELVEALASHDEAESVQMDIARKRRVTRRERILSQVITDIYTAVHSHDPIQHPCYGVHGNWREKAEHQFKKLVEV